MDAKIRLIIDLQDPSIVDDLRQHNPGRPPKYATFWEECRLKLQWMSVAMDSSHILQKQCQYRTCFSRCHRNVHQACQFRQSNGYDYSQFWPKNPTNKTALQFTGKLDVKFMVQARQLRKWHIDAHYCACLFRYLKSFSIKYRSNCQLIFMDDKHRCKIGEPGLPVATVEGHHIYQFAVADHDYTKFGIIPSVTMLCDIPEKLDDSFYRGQVYVGLKNAVLEASSPLRHATELGKILSQEGFSSPLLLLTLMVVQITILLFWLFSYPSSHSSSTLTLT